MTARRRRAVAAALALAAVCALSGCTRMPEVVAGLTVDAQGHLVAVAVSCDYADFDGAHLVDVTHPKNPLVVGAWQRTSASERATGWSLTDSGGEWSAVRPWDGTVDSDHRFELRVGMMQGRAVTLASDTEPLVLDADDIARLTPGRYMSHPSLAHERLLDQTYDNFLDAAC